MSALKKLKARLQAIFLGNRASLLEEDKEAIVEDGYSWIPNWQRILGEDWDRWQMLLEKPRNGPRVLITTMVGGNSSLSPLETVYAVALTLRGADVHLMICDKALDACQNCQSKDRDSQEDFIKNGPSACDWCFDVGMRSLGQLGLPIVKYSDYVESSDYNEVDSYIKDLNLDQLLTYESDGVDHSDIVKSSVLRYFGRCDLENEPLVIPIARRFLTASLITNKALNRLFKKNKYDHVLSNQAMYVPQLNVAKVANLQGSHLVAWDLGYRQNTVNFCHDETHLFALANEPNENWERLEWSEDMESEIREYLGGRWSSKYDWLKILTEGEETAPDDVLTELGINREKPIIGMLTNVLWDAQVSYKASAYPNQIAWIVDTIKYFAERQDLQLLIRIHPSELYGWIESRQFVLKELEKHFDRLPENVFVIPPDSKINTYKAMMNCDTVLIYGTTAGLEMLCMGIPVIVSGRAWIRNKKLCKAVSTPEEFIVALNELPRGSRLNEAEHRRALKYAYHFYLRRMIPLSCTEPFPAKFAPYRIKQQPLSAFDKGSDPGLDVICDGILNRSEFIYAAEKSPSRS